MSETPDAELEDRVIQWLDGRTDALSESLRELVDAPSGPHERDGQRACLELLVRRWRRIGFRTEILEAAAGLGHLVAHRPAEVPDAPKVLLLGHLDTVFDQSAGFVGMHRVGEWLAGPGVADMKGGLVVARAVVESLLVAGQAGAIDWTLLVTSDEEIGSPTSRSIVERTAAGRDLVLCFEPGRSGFAVVDGRAGVAAFSVAFHGRAAHAGVDPERGRNAIVAAAAFAVEVGSIADAGQGTLVSVGTISGGSKRNVVPELCRLELDARAQSAAEAERVVAAVQALASDVGARHEVRAEVRGGFHRPPWPRDPHGPHAHFAAVAKDLGMPLPAVTTGGGSDANLAASAGAPTLDGLGPVGFGMHSTEERIERHTLVERAKLIALALLRFRPQPHPEA
ncbi:MAG: M20/M25/M40 family metallo-hydrolase [Deltaproteobacteria bacterium]|nr:M20/M25/M40 family metallo-hydrolase [Deltaproteobacteria bacterium]